MVLDQPATRKIKNMHKEPKFPSDRLRRKRSYRARRVTPAESQKFRAAVSEQFGLELKKLGRPSKEEDKYESISIRLHPKILVWAKEKAEKQGIGYQTVINELLLAQIGRS
jgi:predicted DNA binding CopG/RHH family protein